VGGKGEILQALVLVELDVFGSDAAFVFEVDEKVADPVEPLFVEEPHEVEKCRVSDAVIEPKDAEGVSCQRNFPQSRRGRLGSSAN